MIIIFPLSVFLSTDQGVAVAVTSGSIGKLAQADSSWLVGIAMHRQYIAPILRG